MYSLNQERNLIKARNSVNLLSPSQDIVCNFTKAKSC